jgi:hypothetical protein
MTASAAASRPDVSQCITSTDTRASLRVVIVSELSTDGVHAEMHRIRAVANASVR